MSKVRISSESGITLNAGGDGRGAGWIPCLSATLPIVPPLSNEMAWTKWLGLLHHRWKGMSPQQGRENSFAFAAADKLPQIQALPNPRA